MDAGSPIISGEDALDAFVAAAARAPAATALLCDIDGTLSPIAPRPADAFVPAPVRDLLTALVQRLGLLVFATGRSLEDGRRMVAVDGAVYVGTHGLEVMAPDGAVTVDREAGRYAGLIHRVAEAASHDLDCEALGVVLEDKRTMLAVHYRLAADPAATRHEILTRVVEPAKELGLVAGTGHFVFEIRPPVAGSKGTAVRDLLRAGDYVSVMSCGDDLTDVTMFDAVAQWGEADARRAACRVAAVTDETPRPVIDAADVLVRATPGVHEVLSRLAAAVGAV